MVLKQTQTQTQIFERISVLEHALPKKVKMMLSEWVDWQDNTAPVLLSQPNDIDTELPLEDLESTEEAHQVIISTGKINDARYINKFFESVNERLALGGYFVGSVETSSVRKARIQKRFPSFLGKGIYFADYSIHRVLPKLPRVRKMYFAVTKGKNRALSEFETFGRLYSCGFKLCDSIELDGLTYFIATKIGEPDFNTEATYGPLINLRRVGHRGKLIKVYKLRTMYPYSEYLQEYIYERNGLQEGGKLKDDPRVTAAGKFFRKYWFDEIPMLINLLRGDMKLIGVRPISRHYFGLYPEEFQEFRKQFRPGLVPPVYITVPKTLDDVVAVERAYLEEYEKHGWITDVRYCWKIFHSILIKRIRSH